LVEALVEVAVGLSVELRGAALQAVGLDVAAEGQVHGFSFLWDPPGGWVVKSAMVAIT